MNQMPTSKDDLIESLLKDNLVLLLRLMATEAADKKSEPFVDQVEAVIKGVKDGKIGARQVDELHEATGRAKQDRAVHRSIVTRMAAGLIVGKP